MGERRSREVVEDEDDDVVKTTINEQFSEFSKYMDDKRNGKTITLYRSDFWMRQAKVLDDRKLTMTDTGVLFYKFRKTELNWHEWMDFLVELCVTKNLDLEEVQVALTNCGLPGITPVRVPCYRDFFLTYVSKKGLVNAEPIQLMHVLKR